MKFIHNNKGFTFVELIVVLAIFGILAAGISMYGTHTIAKGRDAERQKNMRGAWDIIRMDKNDTGDFPSGIEEAKAIFDKNKKKLSSGLADLCYFIAASEGMTDIEHDDDFAIATWGETTSTKETGTAGIIVFGTMQAMANLSEAELGSGSMQLSASDFYCDNPDGFAKIYDIFTGS